MSDVIFNDEIIKEMMRISKEQEKSPMERVAFDMSQFNMLETDVDYDIATASPLYVEHAIVREAVDYDADKSLLSEKKKALELDDIVELAHPETAFMADGPMGTGVVENQNQQHQKILNTIFKMPTGFHFNTFAELISGLSKLASDLESNGKIEAARKVDETSAYLVSLKKKAADALIPSEVETAEEFRRRQTTKLPPSPKGVVPTTPPQKVEFNFPNQRSLPNSEKLKGLPPSAPTPSGQITPIEPIVTRPVEKPQTSTQPHQAPGQPHQAPKQIEVSKSPIEKVKVKSKNFLGSLSKSVKGGRWGAILSAIGWGVTLYSLLSSAHDSIVDDSSFVMSHSSGDEIKKVLSELESFASFLKSKGEATNDDIAKLQKLIDQLELLSQNESPEVQAKVAEIIKSYDTAGEKAYIVADQAAKEQGEKIPTDDERIRGIQSFFKEHFDSKFQVTGVMDKGTRDGIHDFVEGMRNELGVNPQFLNDYNLMHYSDRNMLEELYRIWTKPHHYVNPS